jgi:hypothetical protein
MAIGSGLGSSFGFSAESTYGTYVAPTKFIRHKSASVQKTATRPQGEGIQAGGYGMFLPHFVEAVTGGTGTVAFDVVNKNMGLFMQALMGTTVTPVQQGTSTAYLQTHTLGDPFGKALSVQVGMPQRGGTVTPATLKGTKVSKLDLSCSVDSVLSATATLDAQAYDNSTSLASVSYATTTNVFHGGQLSVKIGTFGSESAISGVKSVTCSIERGMDTAAYYAGATVAGTKSEPVLNAATAITAGLTVDFIDTTLHAIARDATNTSLVLEWVGPTIASTYKETFRVTVPGVVIEAPESFGVDGRNVLGHTFNFVWKYDGTNSPKIEVISAESAL